MTEQQQPIEMPSFDFSSLSFESDEEMDAADAAAKGGGFKDKYFSKPGQYDTVIAKVDYLGKAKNDDTWVNLVVHFEGTDGKTINSLVQVPTQDVVYGPKKTTFVFKKLKDFCRGIGHDLTVKNVKDTVKKNFARPEKLVGKAVSIIVGYPEKRGYVTYAGKNQLGGAVYNLMDQQHQPLRSADGILEFSDKASAELYATEQMIPVEKYTQVLSYASAVGKTAEHDDFF